MSEHKKIETVRRLAHVVLVLAIMVTFGAGAWLIFSKHPAPQERTITIRAHRYGYEPPVLRVNKGDTLKLRFISEDVIHGFYLEGYDLDVTIFPMRKTVELRRPGQPDKKERVEEIILTADREGKFRYRCSRTCGFMHPFMLGELIVEPNRLFPVSVAFAVGLLVGGFVLVLLRGENEWEK